MISIDAGEYEDGLGSDCTRCGYRFVSGTGEEFQRIEDAFRSEKQVQGRTPGEPLAIVKGHRDGLPQLSRKRK